MTKIFLSYARGDDGEPYEPSKSFVARLHADLTKEGFDVWFDRVSMPSRQLTFHQEIKDAIRERDRLIYIAGPKAAISDYVREEWRFALESDKLVIPILRKGDFDVVPGELCLIHTEDFRDDNLYPAQLAKLIANLKRDEPPLGKLFAVPNLPAHFLGRPDILRRIKDAVLIDLQKPVVHTSETSRVGLQGMGGIGKSVLAAAVARDREIRRSYPDGVIWISFGQNLEDGMLAQLMRDVALHLGDPGLFENVAQGQGVLRNLLLDKAVLLVLDDVWRAKDAQGFDLLGPRCRALVTTRDVGILHTLHGVMYPVALFTEQEALSLLAAAVEQTPDQLPPAARDVVRECGCLPLAVALCGGMAKKRDIRWDSILQRLRRADLEKIADREAINEQHRSIYRAMQVSVEALEPEEQQRFAELSVFVTDQTVPEAAVGTLWAQTGNLDDLDTEDLLINFRERALIRLNRDDATPDGKSERRMSLHDLLYDYAVRTAGDQQALNQTLLDAYDRRCPDGWPSGPDDGYFFQQLVGHQADAGAWMEAGDLVTDFPWLMRKCELGLFDSISSDYMTLERRAPAEIAKRLEIWSDFFREKAHILRRSSTEWPAHKILLQLAVEHADDSPLTLRAEQWLVEGRCDWLWLRRILRLPHAQKNPCLAVLEGHTGIVSGVLELSNGRLLSWSSDHTLRLWNGQSGACLAVLKGHTEKISGALALADERLLTWSVDKTLRVWNVQTGECLAVLQGHTRWVKGALTLADGRLLSWSGDNTLRIWDMHCGGCLTVLEGHTGPVEGAFELANGRLLSWSWDKTLRLWDGQDGACLTVFEGHAEYVTGALALPDGRLLSRTGWPWSEERLPENSWSGGMYSGEVSPREFFRPQDNTLRLWDAQSGTCLTVLRGHTNWVSGTIRLTDGRLLSWSMDKTLRLWDAQRGVCVVVLKGHTCEIRGAMQLGAGHLLSWSWDGELRIWDAQTGDCRVVLRGHNSCVLSVLVLRDGRLMSWSRDKTLRLWNAELGICLGILEGHTSGINSAIELLDGRLLSSSEDGTLRLWDAGTREGRASLEGHNNYVWGTLVLSDKRILSWSEDNTLRIWDSQSGACIAVLVGHTGRIEDVRVLREGKLLSSSEDGSIRLWDFQNGACLAELGGHSRGVKGIRELANGRLLSWAGDTTLRIWDSQSGARLAMLEGHTQFVAGALELADGKLLSWARCPELNWDWRDDEPDCTLRLWDSQTGASVAVFEGHTREIEGAKQLEDGRVLSWAEDNTFRLWDVQIGACLEVVPKDQVGHQHPDWLHPRGKAWHSGSVFQDFAADSSARAAYLRHRALARPVACWSADSDARTRCLFPDGRMVVTLANGQVCILKLQHGERRVSLADAEALLLQLRHKAIGESGVTP
ncbi:MAG: TIR domain-containing protein [Desulfomonile tiedjei]|uniref:TIR domain-containing protein n=1 Tax=Desulfomonile tiedjei TaxID=2358 RepID=A0A9D6UZ67_9BACT|nr:TIR domain-containing protein [Desulfomonile tiedjei]